MKIRSAKLTQPTRLVFLAEDKDPPKDAPRKFNMLALSGQPVAGFFESFVFDLKGVSFAKPRIGILNEHMRDSRIGFADEKDMSVGKQGLTLSGTLLSNAEAQRVAQDADDGFPLESSVGISWQDAHEERPEEGETCEVNGLNLTGPITVVRKATLKETSIVSLGRDDKTSTKIMCLSSEEASGMELRPPEPSIAAEGSNKQGDTPMTPEAFAAKNPQVVAAWKQEGSEGERARLLGMYEALKDYDSEMVLTAIVQGKTLSEVQGMVLADMKKKNEALALKLTQNAGLTSAGAAAPAALPTTPATGRPGRLSDEEFQEKLEGESPEEQAKLLWKRRKDLRMEFPDIGSFTAYYKAEIKSPEAHRVLGGADTSI